MQILLPMAGEGKRFYDYGYKTPKPLIKMIGKPTVTTLKRYKII